ncbi:outer membrane protein assembly factor BamE [Stakelama flava]|uniref:outer membrane protein assembly factor BamE n=1 Tax=Stakelama flava TaxID=2860338 RepID=UPI001FE6CDEC|nr:outer membrane protein assembly factor BamE [Stakelama flava]
MKSLALGGALAGAALTGGCAKVAAHHGYVFDPDLVNAVQPGVDDRDSVATMLGKPTLQGEFNSPEWYYWGRNTRSLAYTRPNPVEQTVVRIRFDKNGTVSAVDKMGMEQVATINPTDDKTPTLGRKRGFFQDLFGNIGTVTPGGMGGSAPQQ